MMFTSKVEQLRARIVTAVFFMILFITSPVMGAQPCAVDPATGGANILPNVLLLFDNSYSMCLYANVDLDASKNVIVDYDKNKTYSGIFDPDEQYTYIGTATNLTNTGYFEQNAGGEWSGNFLNWVTALRIDVARKVLTGGRHTTDNQYTTSNTWVNFVQGYEATDSDYYEKVNVSIVPRPYPYLSPSTADANQTPRSSAGDSTTYYYTNIGRSGTNDWSRLLVKTAIPSNFRTTHEPVTGDYVYNIRIHTDSSNLQGLLDDLVDKVRLGLMHFNGYDRGSYTNEGGYIVNYVKKLDSTSQLPAIKDKLNRTLGDTWVGGQTTLAESLYEATRFFGQLSPRFNGYTVSQANDPLYYSELTPAQRYGCGKNYVIIVTDGESTEDRSHWLSDDNIPGTSIKIKDAYPDKAADGTDCDASPKPCNLEGCGYYGKCVNAEYPFCDIGVDPGCNYGNGSAYLDDVAYMAKNYSFRTVGTSAPTVTTHTVYMFGTGSGVADILLQNTAARGGGLYYTANSAQQLKDNLFQIFSIITNVAAAAASTAITSEPVSGVDLIYIPYYTHPAESQWLGNIRAFRIGSDGSLVQGATGTNKAYDVDNDLVLDNPKWDATLQLQSKAGTSGRIVYTYIPGQTNPYLFESSHTTYIGPFFDADLNKDTYLDEIGDNKDVNPLMSYIRGSDAPTGFTAALLRDRQNNYIGDIMHANPIFVGKPSTRFDLIYGDDSYRNFYFSNEARAKVLYAPANDGMLHCFDAETGEEKWAYIPYNLLPHLKWLADPNYGTCHTYYLDLTANVWDMKIGLTPQWRSILVGGMRLGGTPQQVDTDNNGTPDTWLRSAFFALDVTDPNSINFLWELNDNRFGYTVSKPTSVKVGNNWYLVFGSGPKSVKGEGAPTAPGDNYTDNTGYIFVIDMNSGNPPTTPPDVYTIPLGSWGAGNFFSSPVAIDYDMDYSVDMIYIGDALGNLWRLKTFSDSGAKTYATSPSDWAIDVGGASQTSQPNPQPLLSLGTSQPIVVKPTLSMDAKGRVWIYFGTGRYYCAGDNDNCGVGNVCPTTSVGCTFNDTGSLTRSKYIAVGVYDRHWYNDANPANSKFVLQGSTLGIGNLDHRVLKSGTIVGASTETGYYSVDATTGDIATDVSTNGWYFHLLDAKERSLGDYLVYQGGIFFISYEPNTTDPCSNNGGISYLYGVNYLSGTSTMQSMFDLTGDKAIDNNDLVHDAVIGNRGGVLIQLPTGYAGGGIKIKVDDNDETNAYTPLTQDKIRIEPPGEEIRSGITSWREVLQ
jgi:type IV pilus assembly protein PilY1